MQQTQANRDWTANSCSTYATLGASNHSSYKREGRDFYATHPDTTRKFLEKERFSENVWECACGRLDMSKVLEEYGYNVRSSDIEDRVGNEVLDFLSCNEPWHGDIVTNPPYRYAQEFVEKSLDLLQDGHKCAFLLRIQFLEGIKRRKLFDENPPKTVYVFSKRAFCARNGEFGKYKGVGSAIAYAWFVWEKGYKGDTVVKWI